MRTTLLVIIAASLASATAWAKPLDLRPAALPAHESLCAQGAEGTLRAKNAATTGETTVSAGAEAGSLGTMPHGARLWGAPTGLSFSGSHPGYGARVSLAASGTSQHVWDYARCDTYTDVVTATALAVSDATTATNCGNALSGKTFQWTDTCMTLEADDKSTDYHFSTPSKPPAHLNNIAARILVRGSLADDAARTK